MEDRPHPATRSTSRSRHCRAVSISSRAARRSSPSARSGHRSAARRPDLTRAGHDVLNLRGGVEGMPAEPALPRQQRSRPSDSVSRYPTRASHWRLCASSRWRDSTLLREAHRRRASQVEHRLADDHGVTRRFTLPTAGRRSPARSGSTSDASTGVHRVVTDRARSTRHRRASPSAGRAHRARSSAVGSLSVLIVRRSARSRSSREATSETADPGSCRSSDSERLPVRSSRPCGCRPRVVSSTSSRRSAPHPQRR